MDESDQQFSSVEYGLIVKDISASKDFYCSCLHFFCHGFTYAGTMKAYCQVFSGKIAIGLWQSIAESNDSVSNALLQDYCNIMIWVKDLNEYWNSLENDIRPSNITRTAGIDCFTVRDLDGYTITFCQSP